MDVHSKIAELLRMLWRRFLSLTKRKRSSQNDFLEAGDFFGLEDIRPIGNLRGDLITNKAGRGVLRARYQGQDVKVYEAFSAEQALFIAAVSSSLPDMFPSVLELRGAWVIAEWVEGAPLKGDIEAQQEHVLRRIHALPLSDLPPAGFCYLRDFILPRYQRAAALAGDPSSLDDCLSAVESDNDPTIIMHPDVSPDNLLCMPDGRVVCIDNELLCTGRMPLLDLCNALRPLSLVGRKRLAQNWFANVMPTREVVDRLAQAWIMREAGAGFIRGDMKLCQSLCIARRENAARCLPFEYCDSNRSHE